MGMKISIEKSLIRLRQYGESQDTSVETTLQMNDRQLK